MSVNTDEPIGYQDITVKYREHGEYQYFASFVVSFGYRGVPTNETDDPGIILARLWADGELIFDYATPTKAKPGLKWYVKYGHSDQMPIPGYELAYRDQLLVCFTDYPLGDSASIPTISAEFIDEQTYSVAGIMQSIALLAGYTEEQIITEGLSTSLVLGYVLDGTTTLETVATELGFLYDFTTAENAGVITFAHKYETGELVIDQVIPEGYLALLGEGSADNRIDVTERSADQSLPSKISAQYFDVDANFETGNQTVQRNGGPIRTHASTGDISVRVPIVAEGADIRSRLYDALTKAWQERNGHSLRLPPMYMALNPGNTIQWSNYGATYTGVLVKTTLNADNSTSVSVIEKDADYLPAILATQPPSTPVSWVGVDVVNTVIFDLVDTEEDQVQDGFLNLRLAMGGIAPDMFHGARFDLAPVGPLPAWVPVVTLSAAEEVMLAALDGTPAANATTLRITLRNMTAARLTDGIGAPLAVGNGSTAEVVTYTGVTPVGGDVYDLTGVARGLFGSDLFINVHLDGEGVAFVDDMPIFTIPVSDYVSGVNYLYRTVPFGLPDYDADTFVFVPSGNSRKPYSPENAVATRNLGGDWIITWDEDVRFTGEPDSIYSIDIFNEDWSQVVRRIQVLDTSVTGNTYTYYIEEQVIDGVNELDFVNALIYQINASHVGRGFPGGGVFFEVVELAGTIDANPTFTADLDIFGTIFLAGSIDPDPSFTAGLSVGASLEGTVDVNPLFAAEIQIGGVELEGSIDANPAFTADLEVTLALAGTVDVDPAFVGELESNVAAPVVVDSTSNFRHSTTNGTMAINTPTTIANDIIVAFIFRGGATLEAAPYTVPVESGWTLIDDETTAAEGRYAAFWRLATGSEPATYSFTQTGRTSGILVSIRGADTSAPIDATATNALGSAANNIDAPSVNATTTDDLLLCAAGFFTVGGNSSAGTITDPSGMTSVEFVNSSGTSNGTAASVAALTLTASGATGTKNFGWPFSRLAISGSILIKP